MARQAELLPGTLDLLILKTLDAMGPLHGYRLARRIEQISGDLLQLNQGSIYPALVRLEQKGWIKGEWGESENRRRAKFYRLTRSGRHRLDAERRNWQRVSIAVTRMLEAT